MKNIFEKLFSEENVDALVKLFASAGAKIVISLIIIFLGFKVVNTIVKKIRKAKLSAKPLWVFAYLWAFSSLSIIIILPLSIGFGEYGF